MPGTVRRAPGAAGRRERAAPFPFNAAHRLPYYRARNAIYHLFRALLETKPSLTVLAPDYYSGNEIMAMQAAGATIHYCPVGPDMQWDPDEVERLCRVHDARPSVRHPLRRMAAADRSRSPSSAAGGRCCSSRIARSRF